MQRVMFVNFWRYRLHISRAACPVAFSKVPSLQSGDVCNHSSEVDLLEGNLKCGIVRADCALSDWSGGRVVIFVDHPITVILAQQTPSAMRGGGSILWDERSQGRAYQMRCESFGWCPIFLEYPQTPPAKRRGVICGNVRLMIANMGIIWMIGWNTAETTCEEAQFKWWARHI